MLRLMPEYGTVGNKLLDTVTIFLLNPAHSNVDGNMVNVISRTHVASSMHVDLWQSNAWWQTLLVHPSRLPSVVSAC